jgi:hypothetical protein
LVAAIDYWARTLTPNDLRNPPGTAVVLRWRIALIAALILLQFALGVYNPLRYIPGLDMWQAGDRLVQRIASIQGPVLVLMHPYYAHLAGKEPATQIATLWYARERGALLIPADFADRIQSQYYTVIISDESFFETQSDIRELIGTYYYPAQVIDLDQSPSTNTGVVVRPTLIYFARQEPSTSNPLSEVETDVLNSRKRSESSN